MPTRVTALCLVVLLSACGGSGGGSGTGNHSNSPNNGVHTVYPWRQSATAQTSIVLHGIARDDAGIESVTVNDVSATLVPTGTDPELPANSIVRWSLPVNLAPAGNTFLASAQSSQGTSYVESWHTSVALQKIPSTFLLDEPGSRLVGTTDDYETRLESEVVAYDYAEGLHHEYTAISGLSCIRADLNEGLHLQNLGDVNFQIQGFDLDTEAVTRTIALPAEATEVGESVAPLYFFNRLLCESGSDTAWLHIDAVATGVDEPFRLLRLVEIDLGDGETDIIREQTGDDAPLWYSLTLDQGRLLSLADSFASLPDRLLQEINTDTGAETTLASGSLVYGDNLVVGETSDVIYYVRFNELYRITLNGDPDPTPGLITDSLVPGGYGWWSMAYEPTLDRLLLGNNARIYAVDTENGDYDILAGLSPGSGAIPFAPKRLVLTDTATFVTGGAAAYFHERLDIAGNHRVLEVDLANGSRRLVAENFPVPEVPETSEPVRDFEAEALAIDADGDYLYLGFRQGVVRIAIADGSTTLLAAPADVDTLLSDVTSLVLDEPDNRLLIADRALDAVVALDLGNHEQSIYSQPGERGLGPDFSGIRALTQGNGGVYALNNDSPGILYVDNSGDRTLVTDHCLGGLTGAHQLSHDPANNELLILGSGLYGFDLDSLQCRTIRASGSIFRDIKAAPNGGWLVTHSQSLSQLSPDGDEFVFISR